MANVVEIGDLPGGENAERFEGGDHGATVSCFLVHSRPGAGPVLHRHPYEETFIVQEGTATFTVEEETVEAHAGQIVVVPPGAAHKFVNSGEEILRQVTIHPAARMEQEDLEEG